MIGLTFFLRKMLIFIFIFFNFIKPFRSCYYYLKYKKNFSEIRLKICHLTFGIIKINEGFPTGRRTKNVWDIRFEIRCLNFGMNKITKDFPHARKTLLNTDTVLLKMYFCCILSFQCCGKLGKKKKTKNNKNILHCLWRIK